MRNMMKCFFIISMLFLNLPIITGCKKDSSDIKQPPENPDSTSSSLPVTIAKDYKLVWQDEFNGNSLDFIKWNYRADGTVRGYAMVSRKTISLDGKGHLVIKVTKDSVGNYYVGETGTQGLFEATYGYFECRAKMNTQIGPHVAFWLQSPDVGITTNDPAKNGAEIDIFEYHRNTPGIVYHNIHWNGYGTDEKSVGTKVAIPAIDTGFHTFGLEWTKDSYKFFVDGKQTWSATYGVSQRKEYIILSTELTGWGGDPKLGNYPDSVVYDYVRVYAPK